MPRHHGPEDRLGHGDRRRSPISFTIDITNNGPGTANNVNLTPPDTLPNGGLDWVIGDRAEPAGTGGTACTLSDADVLSCSIPTLADDATYRVTVTAVTSADDCGTHLNTVTVAAANENPQGTAPNTDDHTITVECPDLTVVKTGSGTVTAGSPISFTIEITNNGPGTANNVNIVGVDTLPNGDLDWVLGDQGVVPTTNGNACTLSAADELDCSIPTPGGRRHLPGDGDRAHGADDCGQHLNTVTVAADNENPQGAPTNTDGHTTTVECPDITVVKTGSGTVTAGSPISFTIEITNNGPGTANNVNIVGVDTLPNGDLDWVLGDQGVRPAREATPARSRRRTSSTARSRRWPTTRPTG